MVKIKIPFLDLIQSNKMLFVTVLMILLAVIVASWVGIVVIGVFYLGMANDWAGLSMEHWLLFGIGLLVIFIMITLIIHLLPIIQKMMIENKIRKKPVLYKGKKVYEFTFPRGSDGGIYTRTYISVDDKDIINFRYQMVGSDELWKKNDVKS